MYRMATMDMNWNFNDLCLIAEQIFVRLRKKNLSASLVLTYDTREVKYYVYGKRKSRICTTGKFPL